MPIKHHKVFITSVSASTCAGNSIEKSFDSVLQGKSGIQNSSLYSDNAPAIGLLCNSKTFDQHLSDSFAALGIKKDNSKTFLAVGSSVGGMLETEEILLKNSGDPSDIDPKKHAISSIKNKIERLFDFDDSISFSTACTSSANAISFGFELIKNGAYERVVVAGVDSISRTTVQGFHSLSVLSMEPCKPFDVKRCGMNVSEGVAFLVLENKRVGKCVELLGYGASSDAYNITHPHPDGDGAYMAMCNALEMGGISANEIEYINAHGTATQANDEAEAKAIEKLFADKPYVGSTKSITGHTLGAAGALEAAIIYTAMMQGIIPKNSALEKAENPKIKLPTENIELQIKYALSNSFAFGGNNISILFGIAQ